ncbi:MAG: transketolase [Candidatus Marinimicrobia bacterium]|nr:transketolase [Candidatus Neomarinimicrobiota bacterium]
MHTYKNLDSFEYWSITDKDQFSIAVLKGLIMDGVRKANSGHPGGAMSSADFIYLLFKDYLKYSPQNPEWFDRDRFVLSGGHMSMLQYGILHMVGWMKLSELKKFRQLGSQTPGHPEVDIKGVECTTGPLGQGFAMGVGMAFAEAYLNEVTSKEGDQKLVDHFTYVLATDGDLQEPVSLGAAAIAGHLGLKKLVVYYDANDAQISGKVSRSDSVDYATVFDGLGWNVQTIDGHDHSAMHFAIETAKVMNKPSIIIGNTVMAKGSANMEQDHNTHGAPFSQNEIDLTKEKLGLPDKKFFVPEQVIEHFRTRFNDLITLENEWSDTYKKFSKNSELKNIIASTISEKIISEFDTPDFNAGEVLATRKAFGAVLDSIADDLPQLVGGSADLEPSNYTGNFAEKFGDFTKINQSGRNIPFGVREFPMAAMMNGMALHGGLIPFGGTFLVFADYERPALRLAAIQKIRVIHELTHDSFYVGEDGPTHQPVEQIMSLRAIPDFCVYRPADAKETASCMKLALKNDSMPSALILTRQGVPIIEGSQNQVDDNVNKGAYTLLDCSGSPEIVILASGSEVSLAIEVANKLNDKKIRVVSMPCWELFDMQPNEYKEKLIPKRGSLKVSIEAGVTQGWEKYIGRYGLSIGINHFGSSAPAADLAEKFGFTCDKVIEKISESLGSLL